MKAPLYLLDTNIVTYVVTGRSNEARRHYNDATQHGSIGVSAITEAELRYGLQKKPGATRLQSYVSEFLARTQSFAWDASAARSFSVLRTQTEALGLSFGGFDLLIAAHAHALGAILVTHDRVLLKAADFLSVADWATDV